MSQATELVFYGELLPGFDEATARSRLMSLLKLPPDRESELFSGSRVVLRRRVSAEEGEKYRRYMESIGIRVLVEVADPDAEDDAAVPSGDGAEAAAVPPAPEVARVAPVVTPDVTDAPIREQDDTPSELASALWGFSFSGRMSRTRYVVATSLLMCLVFGALGTFAVLNQAMGAAVVLVAVLVSVVLGLRYSVLRCHDCGWSGWMVLVALIPLVGSIFSLLLFFYPPEKGTNRFGPEDMPASGKGLTLAILGSAVVMIVGLVGVISGLGGSSAFEERIGEIVQEGVPQDPPDARQALLDAYDSEDKLVMYSTEACPVCDQRRQLFDELGIRYVELVIDANDDAFVTFMQRVASEEGRFQPGEAPYFDANGTMLSNPTLNVLAEALAN